MALILGDQSLSVKKQKAKRGKAQAMSGRGHSLALPLPFSLSWPQLSCLHYPPADSGPALELLIAEAAQGLYESPRTWA